MTRCDSCGVAVSSSGFLGGSVICHECAEAKAENDQETLEKRRERYGDAE